MTSSLKEAYSTNKGVLRGLQDRFITSPNGDQVRVGFLITLLSLLYTANFAGLEYHPSWFGNTFQALHPESFPNDKYMPPFRPTMLSIYYLLVRMTGEIWLDDRFIIVVYFGLVLIALIGLDKIARLFGAQLLEERIAILSLMLVGHAFMANQGELVTRGFNTTTLAGPLAIWLLYASLAGKKPMTVIPLMVLLSLISIKNAWLPVTIGLVILFREWLNSRAKIIVGLGTMLLGAIAFVIYYLLLRPPDQTHVVLFDLILNRENTEAHPWMGTPASNILYLFLLCFGGFFARLPSESVLARVKLVALVGFLAWLLGGVYLSYAPDFIKIPYLVALSPTRALWWPQLLLFVAIGVSVLKWMEKTHSVIGLLWSYAIVLALYLTPMNYRRAGVVGILLFSMWLIIYGRAGSSNVSDTELKHPMGRINTIGQEMRLRMIAVVLCFTSLYSYALIPVLRLPALRYMFQHGIVGDNPGAKWVGVNEYFRNETPPSATVLALSTQHAGDPEPERLRLDGSLRIRSGRSMPFGHWVSVYFDYQSILWMSAYSQHLDQVVQSWERQDVMGLFRSLSALGSPDYLVVPTVKAGWLRDVREFNYRVETVIREFTIMRRVASG